MKFEEPVFKNKKIEQIRLPLESKVTTILPKNYTKTNYQSITIRCLFNLLSESNCWSMLKGGLTVEESGPAELYFEVLPIVLQSS